MISVVNIHSVHVHNAVIRGVPQSRVEGFNKTRARKIKDGVVPSVLHSYELLNENVCNKKKFLNCNPASGG